MNKSTLLVFFLLFFVFLACKEDEPKVDKCKNGFKDAGEKNIDCGGICPDCPVTYTPYLTLKINQVETSFSNRLLDYSGSQWTLSCDNDSTAFQFNLGSNGSVGAYPMSPAGTTCTFKGQVYSIVTDGNFAIDSHDTSIKRMSGFFNVKFTKAGTTDTLFITSGQFIDLPY
jgi:hypothetical protein